MGVITPNGDLYLISVDIDATQAHQLWFTSQAAQEAFFQSKSVVGLTQADYTFIQKDEYVRVNKNADQLYTANYLMYRNTAHATKWFFAFIKEIKWLSDQSSAISFETDVYQTWRWDVDFKDSLVERETPPSDLIGEHLIDEGLAIGEYVTQLQMVGETPQYEIQAGLADTYIIVASSVIQVQPGYIEGVSWFYKKRSFPGDEYNGIYSGTGLLAFENTMAGRAALAEYLKQITMAGAQEAITAIYMCPKKGMTRLLVNFPIGDEDGITWPAVDYYMVSPSSTGYTGSVTGDLQLQARPSSIEGWTPRNKKLLSNPYCTVYAHNGNGSSAVFDIDRFPGTGIKFKTYGSVLPMPTYKMVPQDYAGVIGGNVDEALTLSSFPMCSYPIDGYKAWMAQSGVPLAMGVGGSAIAAAASVAIMPAAAPAAGLMAVSSAAQAMAKHAEAGMRPVHAEGNANSGSVNSTMGKQDFFVSYKTIRQEWAKMLDDYFTMFGYKVNQLKVPSFGCREKWYFVKLINPNITGPVPVADMKKLKNIFASGVTLWNDHSQIGDYSLSNLPIV